MDTEATRRCFSRESPSISYLLPRISRIRWRYVAPSDSLQITQLNFFHQVYEMKGTGEVFTDYEKYLKRFVQLMRSPLLMGMDR